MIFSRIVILVLTALSVSCASSPSNPVLDASTLLGRWQNRSGGFFRMSWDQCEFFRDQSFSCTSYPLKEDVALTYDGTWSLADNTLQLQLGRDQTYTYYIIDVGRDSFTIDSRMSGVRTFYRVSKF